MEFENCKPVKKIRSSMNEIGKDVGIYRWWFKDSCFMDKGYYPLNIKDNAKTKDLHNKLKELRKEISSWP